MNLHTMNDVDTYDFCMSYECYFLTIGMLGNEAGKRGGGGVPRDDYEKWMSGGGGIRQ